MQRLLVLAFVVVLAVAVCFSQSADPYSLSTAPQSTAIDCSDPSMAGTDQCNAQSQNLNGAQQRDSSSPSVTAPVLSNPLGGSPDRYTPATPPPNP